MGDTVVSICTQFNGLNMISPAALGVPAHRHDIIDSG